MSVEIRDMKLDDLDAVVSVHRAAFPTFFLSSLGDGFLRQFYRAIVEFPDGIALVGEVDGVITGFAAGSVASRGFYRRLFVRRSVRIGLALLPAVVAHPQVLMKVVRRTIQRTSDAPTPAGAELMSLAVDPKRQKHGLGRALLDAFGARVARENQRAVWLTTDSVHNERVQRFYENAGFTKRRTFLTAEGRQLDEYKRVF